MNLTRVLNNALPDIPARTLSERPPRVSPDIVSQEHIEDGKPTVRVVVRGVDAMFKFPRSNWDLIQLFDGNRSYEEIAEAYSNKTGQGYSEEEVREFAESLEEMGFWYKTSQEKNVMLLQKTAEERRKLLNAKKNRFGDLSEIPFPAVDPDKFVTWWYGHTKWVYTWWFTILTVLAFLISIAISTAHWDEVGGDTLKFFNFSHKSFGDLLLFYLLAIVALCWHELGHAHACKHYGGRVPAMGFLLIYLTPAFFTDTTEGFVKGTRYQRFIISMAGAWSELYICAIATPIWWATPPGSIIHEAAYMMVLMTGIAGVLINWNPLMKLDGYYMLGETLGIAGLKEDSTAYVSAWVKRNIWRLPVEVPYVPKRRRLGFAVYALLSGAYSYTVLYVLARFVGNVFRNFNPEWSFLPELATAGLIFRSRIRNLVNFMKFLYLDKKDRIRSWFLGKNGWIAGVAAVLLFVVPIWPESTDGHFVLETVNRAIVRNTVGGTVADVLVGEGAAVKAGQLLVRLRNLPLQSKFDEGGAQLEMASKRASQATIQYANLGPALQEREQLRKRVRELEYEVNHLDVLSPMDGVVLSPRTQDLLGGYKPEGTELLEIGDTAKMKAKISVSDYDMYKVRVDSRARINVPGIAKFWTANTAAITPVSTESAPAKQDRTALKGLNVLNYYVVDLMIDNPTGELKPGMAGMARIYGPRRSLVGHFLRGAARFFGRKIW